MEYWDVNVPRCMSPGQAQAIRSALEEAESNPGLLCDFDGEGAVGELEGRFARLCGARHALAVTSGTAAIHAGLLAAGVGKGDEVITTPYSWPQTVSPIIFTGATPVFADILPGTLHLDVDSVRRRLSRKTKAILVTHLFGHVADMPSLEQLAKDAGVVLIADAAHALSASLHGGPVGSRGDMACFSLGRGKLLNAGEGGILVTNDPVLHERAVALTQHPERLWWLTGERGTGLGLNYRLHPLVALLATAGLSDIRARLAHRREMYNAFWEGAGEDILELVQPQSCIPGEDPAVHAIPLTLAADVDREDLCYLAQSRGATLRCGPVGTPLHYRLGKSYGPRPPRHPSHRKGSCPVAEERCRQRELWVMSSLDMDSFIPDVAWEMGKAVASAVKELAGASQTVEVL